MNIGVIFLPDTKIPSNSWKCGDQ